LHGSGFIVKYAWTSEEQKGVDMSKQVNIMVIVLFLILGLFSLSFSQESMTITTYYPSPYGSYRELRAQLMAIGDNYSGPTYCWSPDSCTKQIDSNADLIVEGNVGIGTTSPQAKLGIAGSGGLWTTAGWKKAIEIDSGAVLKWQANSGGWRHGIGQTTDGLYFGRAQVDDNSGAITYNMFIGDSGNVGIGYTFPGTYKLYVNGTGYLNAAAWVYGSDKRLKKNISYLKNGLNIIEQLKPVKFDYIQGDKRQVGFIAQEVEKVLPDIVIKGQDGMLGSRTDSIIPYLVKAIQEQQQEIQALKQWVDRLSKK